MCEKLALNYLNLIFKPIGRESSYNLIFTKYNRL